MLLTVCYDLTNPAFLFVASAEQLGLINSYFL